MLRDLVSEAHRNGYCIIRGLLNDNEVTRLRETLVNLTPYEKLQDFLSNGRFNWLLFDDRVLELASAIVGGDIFYYGETSQSFPHQSFHSWHCDSRGSLNDLDAFYEVRDGEIYNGWRFGFYLDDYEIYSGGLKVSPGSHLRPLLDLLGHQGGIEVSGSNIKVTPAPYPIVNCDTRPGDLVIFNLRLFHSGGFLRHLDPSLTLSVDQELKLKQFNCFAPEPAYPRAYLFFDYCGRGLGPDLYIKWRAHRLLSSPKSLFRDSSYIELVRSGERAFSYDREDIQVMCTAHRVSLRYDRCLAEEIWCHGTFTERANELLTRNEEFSSFYSLSRLREESQYN